MKIKHILLPSLLALGLLLSGCDGTVSGVHTALVDISNDDGKSYTGTCVLMSGTKTKTLIIPEEEAAELRVNITVDAGTMELTLVDKDGTEQVKETLEESKSFVAALEEGGSYKLILHSEKLSGKYSIQWGDPPEENSEEGNTSQ